jgi:TRAP-type uncharacterized transport system substrate-binding protein
VTHEEQRLSGPEEAKYMRSVGAVRLVQGGLLLLAVLMGLRLVRGSAPSELLLFAGGEASTEYEYGERYAKFLTSRGVTTTVVATAGAADNIHRLTVEERPAVGFATSGVGRATTEESAPTTLVALASLYVEPLWLFVREGFTGDSLLEDHAGRVSIGIAGAAAPLATLIMEASGVMGEVVTVTLADVPADSIDQTLDREDLDAVLAPGAIDSEIVEALFSSDAFSPISFERAAAYARRNRFLVHVNVPQGSFDLARRLPQQDLDLLAPTIQLVAPADIHPAIVDLLLEAAREIHREPTFFSDRGEYPSMNHVSLPLDKSAIHFFEDGPPKLREFLPYWASTLVDRFATFATAVLGAMMAIFSVLPRLLGIPMQIKLKRWFAEMVTIEKESMAGGNNEELIGRLDVLDRASADVRVFRFQLTSYLEYRQHIFDARDRLRLRLRLRLEEEVAERSSAKSS